MSDIKQELDLMKKAKKQQANKKYYESVKQLRQLKQDSDIKQDNSDSANFFFPIQKPQIEAAPPAPPAQPAQQIYIPQQPQPKQPTLMNKALETLVLTMIPTIPILIKQCLILYANKQPKPEIQPDQPSMHYSQQMNTLEF